MLRWRAYCSAYDAATKVSIPKATIHIPIFSSCYLPFMGNDEMPGDEEREQAKAKAR